MKNVILIVVGILSLSLGLQADVEVIGEFVKPELEGTFYSKELGNKNVIRGLGLTSDVPNVEERNEDEAYLDFPGLYEEIDLIKNAEIASPEAEHLLSLLDDSLQERIAKGEFFELSLRSVDVNKDRMYLKKDLVERNDITSDYTVAKFQVVFGVRFKRADQDDEGNYLKSYSSVVEGTNNHLAVISVDTMNNQNTLLRVEVLNSERSSRVEKIGDAVYSLWAMAGGDSNVGTLPYDAELTKSIAVPILKDFFKKPEVMRSYGELVIKNYGQE